MAPVIPHWAQPSHPDLIRVVLRPKAFTSSASSLVALPAGSLFTRLETATPAPKAYSSVQVSRDEHIELNSDLIYCNHSCAPSLEFDMHKYEIRVARDRDLKVGDALTFYYPSTEFDMAQPFRCECSAGETSCKGWIAGAGRMPKEALEGYWLNEHIEILLAEQEAADAAENGYHHAQGISNGEVVDILNGSQSAEDGSIEHQVSNGATHGASNGVSNGVSKGASKGDSNGVSNGASNWSSNGLSHQGVAGDTVNTVNRKTGASSRELGGEMGGDTGYTVNGKTKASSRKLGGEMSGDTTTAAAASVASPTAQ